MALIIDFIIVGIIALSVYLGYKRGLVNMLFSILTFFLALIISFIIYVPVTNFIINNTKIDDGISTAIVNTFKDKDVDNLDTEKLKTSKVVEEYIMSYTDEIKNKGIQNVANEFSVIIVRVGVFIIIFTVVRVILFFVKVFANILTVLPLIKEFNKVGGFLYGVIRGFIIVWVILALASIILPVIDSVVISNAIPKTIITKCLYDYNLLLMTLF